MCAHASESKGTVLLTCQYACTNQPTNQPSNVGPEGNACDIANVTMMHACVVHHWDTTHTHAYKCVNKKTCSSIYKFLANNAKKSYHRKGEYTIHGCGVVGCNVQNVRTYVLHMYIVYTVLSLFCRW